MKVIINGVTRETSAKTLRELLQNCDFKLDQIAVECEGKIVPKPAWAEFAVRENQAFEVVEFVAGG